MSNLDLDVQIQDLDIRIWDLDAQVQDSHMKIKICMTLTTKMIFLTNYGMICNCHTFKKILKRDKIWHRYDKYDFSTKFENVIKYVIAVTE